MLVQTSSPLHHCSPDPSNSLPPGVLQPKTYPSSECPVKHPSRSPRQYTVWNCLHLRGYWGPSDCCKPANTPSHRPRRLREDLQLTPTSLSLEPPTTPLSTDTARHPNHAPSTGLLATIARANTLYPWTIPHVAPPGHTYQYQPPQFSFIPAGDSTHILVRGMPQTQQPSTHAAPHRTRIPRQYFSAVASDLTHGRYFGVRSTAAPPAFRTRSTYSRRLPTARTHLRRESANALSPTVSAVINAIRKLSDNDSQASSSTIPNNSTQLGDVPPV